VVPESAYGRGERKDPSGEGSEFAVVGERIVMIVSDHDVVEDGDTEQFAGFFESPGDRRVFRRGSRVATWMVVDEDDRERG